MRKYRYTKTVIVTPWRRAATLIYFLAGWNIIGYIGYKVLSKSFAEKHPEFEEMSNRDKYLSMLGYKTGSLTTITYSPFGQKDSQKESDSVEGN